MLTMTFTNVNSISCSFYKQQMRLNEMKFHEQKLVCAHICIYNLHLKKCFLQNMDGRLDPLFPIIEKILVLCFFPSGWFICEIANSTSSFYIRPLHYKIRNKLQLKPKMIENINYIDKLMSQYYHGRQYLNEF